LHPACDFVGSVRHYGEKKKHAYILIKGGLGHDAAAALSAKMQRMGYLARIVGQHSRCVACASRCPHQGHGFAVYAYRPPGELVHRNVHRKMEKPVYTRQGVPLTTRTLAQIDRGLTGYLQSEDVADRAARVLFGTGW